MDYLCVVVIEDVMVDLGVYCFGVVVLFEGVGIGVVDID